SNAGNLVQSITTQVRPIVDEPEPATIVDDSRTLLGVSPIWRKDCAPELLVCDLFAPSVLTRSHAGGPMREMQLPRMEILAGTTEAGLIVTVGPEGVVGMGPEGREVLASLPEGISRQR